MWGVWGVCQILPEGSILYLTSQFCSSDCSGGCLASTRSRTSLRIPAYRYGALSNDCWVRIKLLAINSPFSDKGLWPAATAKMAQHANRSSKICLITHHRAQLSTKFGLLKFCFEHFCVLMVYCGLNNNTFKLLLIEHIVNWLYLTISFVSHFKVAVLSRIKSFMLCVHLKHEITSFVKFWEHSFD